MGTLDKKNKTITRKLKLEDLDNFELDDSGTLFWKGKKVHTGWFLWQNWLPIIIATLAFLSLLFANFDRVQTNISNLKTQIQSIQNSNTQSSKNTTP